MITRELKGLILGAVILLVGFLVYASSQLFPRRTVLPSLKAPLLTAEQVNSPTFGEWNDSLIVAVDSVFAYTLGCLLVEAAKRGELTITQARCMVVVDNDTIDCSTFYKPKEQ